jgi:hypothetical protein
VPFFTLSAGKQLGGEQVPPLPHTWLVQSVPAAQPWPSGHRGQVRSVPPQSTPVSVPFFTPSVGTQLGALQT